MGSALRSRPHNHFLSVRNRVETRGTRCRTGIFLEVTRLFSPKRDDVESQPNL